MKTASTKAATSVETTAAEAAVEAATAAMETPAEATARRHHVGVQAFHAAVANNAIVTLRNATLWA